VQSTKYKVQSTALHYTIASLIFDLMNLNIKIFLLCPIPDDQKPIQEYISFRRNNFTNWILFSKKRYLNQVLRQFFIFFIGFALFEIPNFLSEFSVFSSIEKICLASFFFVIISSMIGLFLWKQLGKKLESTRLFYEEASWFDGQVWEKPSLLLKNDRLLNSQKITPFLSRLELNILQLLGMIGLWILFSH